MTVVEMHVHMCCQGCENKIRKAIGKLEGIHQVDIDKSMQKVTVMGWPDHHKVLRTVRKTGLMAELWPYQQRRDPSDNFDQYYYQTPNSSNYYKHDYGIHGHGNYFYQPAYADLVKDRPDSMFSDESATGCSIM